MSWSRPGVGRPPCRYPQNGWILWVGRRVLIRGDTFCVCLCGHMCVQSCLSPKSYSVEITCILLTKVSCVRLSKGPQNLTQPLSHNVDDDLLMTDSLTFSPLHDTLPIPPKPHTPTTPNPQSLDTATTPLPRDSRPQNDFFNTRQIHNQHSQNSAHEPKIRIDLKGLVLARVHAQPIARHILGDGKTQLIVRGGRIVQAGPTRGPPHFFPAGVCVRDAWAAVPQDGADGGLDRGVGVAAQGAGDGGARVPAYQVGEVAVGRGRVVDVEFPFLELGVAADVQAFVQAWQGLCEGLD